MAYESGLSGRPEIYVERYSELGGRQQISADGGEFPTWSRDGRELFFSSLDNRQVLAVAVQSGTTLTALRPHTLFEFPINGSFAARPYDVGPDGTFYMIRREQASQLIVVQNWLVELKRLVPRR